jgi:hypothetical protein
MVAFSSLLENYAGVPFTRQWTIRVSQAPETIEVSEHAPKVVDTDVESQFGSRAGANVGHDTMDIVSTRNLSEAITKVEEEEVPKLNRINTTFLETLKKPGFNTKSQLVIPRSKPWSAARYSFYVIISVAGVSKSHAALRVVSKAISVGIFCIGTATFASTTLVTITVTLAVLCMALSAGVFGRVIGLWMASEFMIEQPILQRTVRTNADANTYIRTMLEKPGMMFEINGHVFLNGRCVARYNSWLSWSTFFGILASPFDLNKISVTV